MSGAAANPPRKHHFLPEFYQRSWAGNDGQVERFSLEHGNRIHVRRVPPSAAAQQPDLYRLPGSHEDEWAAQRIETDFFARIDAAAAPALATMIETGRVPTTSQSRTSWMSFILSLMHRTPQHLMATKAKVGELNEALMPKFESDYLALRGQGDPPTLSEWERQRAPHEVEMSAFRVMMELITNPRSGDLFVGMNWVVVDLSAASLTLLTSDNPVILKPLGNADGHFAVPISPHKLFLATPHSAVLHGAKTRQPDLLVKEVNRLTVERAEQVVIARDRASERFIRKWFGTCRIGSLPTGLYQPTRPTNPRAH